MLSVDAVTGEIYLQLETHSKTENVSQYLRDLCEDTFKDNIEKLVIVLDNNSMHKEKIKKQLREHLQTVGIADKIVIEFLSTGQKLNGLQ